MTETLAAGGRVARIAASGLSRSAAASIRLTTLPPLSLYVHVPWCVRKCPYCDFNSHELRAALPEREYVAALIADLDQALPQIWGRTVYTVFFGGGTPSLLSAQAVDAILSAVRARVPLVVGAEITLEANPGTFEACKFADFRAAGVNRLSLGIQSFDDAKLRALGRIHDAGEARAAVEGACATFDNVNLDLMYALPGQCMAEAAADIDAAIAYRTAHLSAYHLTIEPNTLFHRQRPAVPDPDQAAQMQDEVEGRLAAAGYENYEISAFARPGMRCLHNLNYWRFGDYLGIGAGAHSKLSFADRIVRAVRCKQPQQYLRRSPDGEAVLEQHEVAAGDLPFEYAMNALRLAEGFDLRAFEERTGLDRVVLLPTLDRAERAGLIDRDHRHVRPSALGRRFLNDLLQTFLAESP